jgi:cytochrome c oxidase assembly factor CtaG
VTMLAAVSEAGRYLRAVVHFCYSLETMSTLCRLVIIFLTGSFLFLLCACALFACCVGCQHTHSVLTLKLHWSRCGPNGCT